MNGIFPGPNPSKTAFRLMVAIACIAAFSFASCKKKKPKNDNQTETTENHGNCKVLPRLPKALIGDMRGNEFRFEWFSARLDCEAAGDSSSASFEVNVRMRRDSLIWMNVLGPMNIKVARVLISRDSVKLIQYQDGTLNPQPKCFQGDFALLSQLLQTEVDYEMMQSLLVGNSVSFYEEDEKLKSSVNYTDCNYTLGTVRKRRLRKVLDGQTPPPEPVQTISLDPSTFKILKILFIDSQNRTFTAQYDTFEKQDSMLFPMHAVFFARGLQKSAKVDIKYKRVTLNQPQDFPFTFPDDCQPILIPAKKD